MPRTSKLAREKKLWAKQPSQQRAALKKVIANPNSSPDEVAEASLKLQKRPINESACRKVRRCQLCGRTRGVYRMFGMCRCCVRKHMVLGMIPGFVKSS